MCDLDGDSASSRKIPLEARENLPESLRASSQQTVRVPILGSAGPRGGGCRQAVAFQDLDLLKVFAKAPAIDRPPIPAPTTTARRPKVSLMT
jgi:hypothetical protein